MNRAEMKNVTMRMEVELHEELLSLAQKEHLPLTGFAKRMMRKGLVEFKRTGVL